MPLSLFALADQVIAGCAELEPILRRVEAHIFVVGRLHDDNATPPVLATGQTSLGGAAPAPPAACYTTCWGSFQLF
ncbi:MAG: hypothetical protein SH859_11525 [Hyphomicrobium aestuarii]|nr:hypothetical protein [Hyphomicrobium aestuarii]